MNVPLETDLTTPLAYKLEGSDIWDLGVRAFLGKEVNKIPDGLYLREPYRPGKIPVVFVHGTASSPVWWAEMFNTLSFDPLIRQKYQFWYFVYTSNKPIVILLPTCGTLCAINWPASIRRGKIRLSSRWS